MNVTEPGQVNLAWCTGYFRYRLECVRPGEGQLVAGDGDLGATVRW